MTSVLGRAQISQSKEVSLRKYRIAQPSIRFSPAVAAFSTQVSPLYEPRPDRFAFPDDVLLPFSQRLSTFEKLILQSCLVT